MNFSNRPVTLPLASRTAWLLAFFGFAFLACFATPTNRKANLASHRFGVAICSIAACGGSSTSRKHPQNYTVTFTATTASTKQTINFMLTVKKLSLVKFTGPRASLGESLFS
jgi:hypothetical protein